MQGRIRRATAIGAATFALAGSAALAMPGTASAAETKTVPCGSTVEANPGDTIHGTLLGLPLIDLGVVTVSKTLTATVNALLGTVCQVTVTVVNTVVAPIPVVGAPAADALNNGVAGVTNGVSGGIDATQRALSGNPPAQQQPGGAPGNPQSPGSPNAPAGGNPAGVTPIPDSNSPVLAGGFTAPNFSGLPFTFTGYAPMRDYSTIPMVNAGLYSPSPGLRYGGQVPGYAPEFGILGQAAQQPLGGGVQNAGQAEALPGTGGGMVDGAGLPLLIAVLSLSAVSAVLVRTWVLRRMAAAT
ncbi:MAG: hypothetical protein QOI21_1248 [Actinomycetota bacterium]|jgi:hypothetical protein|nr:hypothetical protein [Actinomycetota bacterium]